MSDVGREYFGLEDNPNRVRRRRAPFLRRTDERYDLIIVDAYQPYVPFYLATREFFRLARTG